MSNFKIGDKVRCINNTSEVALNNVQVYIVEGADDDYIAVMDSSDINWYESFRFELVESNQKPPGRPKYVLVEAKKDEFLQQVNELIAQGYKPQGGVSVDQAYYIQALVLGD